MLKDQPANRPAPGTAVVITDKGLSGQETEAFFASDNLGLALIRPARKNEKEPRSFPNWLRQRVEAIIWTLEEPARPRTPRRPRPRRAMGQDRAATAGPQRLHLAQLDDRRTGQALLDRLRPLMTCAHFPVNDDRRLLLQVGVKAGGRGSRPGWRHGRAGAEDDGERNCSSSSTWYGSSPTAWVSGGAGPTPGRGRQRVRGGQPVNGRPRSSPRPARLQAGDRSSSAPAETSPPATASAIRPYPPQVDKRRHRLARAGFESIGQQPHSGRLRWRTTSRGCSTVRQASRPHKPADRLWRHRRARPGRRPPPSPARSSSCARCSPARAGYRPARSAHRPPRGRPAASTSPPARRSRRRARVALPRRDRVSRAGHRQLQARRCSIAITHHSPPPSGSAAGGGQSPPSTHTTADTHIMSPQILTSPAPPTTFSLCTNLLLR